MTGVGIGQIVAYWLVLIALAIPLGSYILSTTARRRARSSACCTSRSASIRRAQAALPRNPNDRAAVDPRLAWNTATSFATNTNWQAYGGETTMSNLAQSVGGRRADQGAARRRSGKYLAGSGRPGYGVASGLDPHITPAAAR